MEVSPMPCLTEDQRKYIWENLKEHSIDRIAEEVEAGTSGCAGAPVPIRTDDLRWMLWATRTLTEIMAKMPNATQSDAGANTEIDRLRAALAASQERVKLLEQVERAAREVVTAECNRKCFCARLVIPSLANLHPAPARDGRKEKP